MKNIFLTTLLFCFLNSAFAVDIISGQQSFAFHGYIRSSLGLSKDDTTMPKFQLPGTRGAYRLGNEPDTSIELQFDHIYKLKDPENENANIKSVFMLAGYKRLGESNDIEVDQLAQAYLSFNKFFNNDVDVWFGRRFYQRKINHILNDFWLNPGQNSHMGVGFEGLALGSGKLDLALFKNEDNTTADLINSTVIDARWNNLSVSDNTKLTMWAQLANRAEVGGALNFSQKSGHSVGGWLDFKSTSMKNTLSGTNQRIVREDLGWNLDNASVFEINNMMTYEMLPKYSFQWSAVYRKEDKGTVGDSTFEWWTTGIRPVFYLSKHVNIALEAGIDYVEDKLNDRSGNLNKFTVALQLAADRGFKSRPVIRFFVTVASWDDDFKGLVGNSPGNAPFANELSGWSLGTQLETWW